MTFDLDGGKSVTISVAFADMATFAHELERGLGQMAAIANRRADEVDAAVKLLRGR